MRAITSIISALFFILATPSSAAIFGNIVDGSGKITSESRTLQSFHELRSSIDAQIFITPGQKSEVVIEGDDNIVPLIKTEVKNQGLSIHLGKSTAYSTTLPLTIRITTPSIDFIHLYGAAQLVSDGELTAEIFTLGVAGASTAKLTIHANHLNGQITGSGRAIVDGSVDREDIQVSGSGTFDARHLKAKDVSAKVTGSGIIYTDASEMLSAIVTGSGRIIYRGHPKVYQWITGSGAVYEEKHDH